MVSLRGLFDIAYDKSIVWFVLTTSLTRVLICADMFYMNASNSRGSVYGAVSVLSGGSNGISLMKSDRRKSRKLSTSEYLLKRRVGSFGS